MNPGSCKHFRGVQHKCCSAGVDWAAEFGTFRYAPCIQFMARTAKGTRIKPGEPYERVETMKREPHEVKNCVWLQLPTEQEMIDDWNETEIAISKTLGDLAAVPKHWRVKPFEDRMEFVTCPICQGQLRLVQSRYNGHVHGQCSTAGCLNWME